MSDRFDVDVPIEPVQNANAVRASVYYDKRAGGYYASLQPVELRTDGTFSVLLFGFKTGTYALVSTPRRGAKAEAEAVELLSRAVRDRAGPSWDAIALVADGNGFRLLDPVPAG